MSRGITGEDVAAMHLATEVSLQNGGSSTLRLYSRGAGNGNPAVVYTERQIGLYPEVTFLNRRARTIETTTVVTGHLWRWSSRDGWMDGGQADPPECLYSPHDREAWATVVRGLGVGDRLEAEWGADCYDGHALRRAGLHVDRVNLRVTHAGGETDVHHLGWRVCPDGASRMIRRR